MTHSIGLEVLLIPPFEDCNICVPKEVMSHEHDPFFNERAEGL